MTKPSITRYILITICALIGCINAIAIPQRVIEKKQKTLLIVNSYNENALWSRAMVAPITYFVANDDSIHAEFFSLNNIQITDSASYNIVKNNFFETYKDHKPDYLVVIGNLAFSFRDEMRERWGDLPMLMITRDLTLAPAEYFYSGYDKPMSDEAFPSIATLVDDFNFTAIYVPDLYRQTIDMMISLIPNMDKLVFLSDAIYLNRDLARNIQLYLFDEYPDISFEWIQASSDRPDDLQYYFVNEMPRTGILMSTWYYEKKNAFGYPALVSGDLNLLTSSINPIFSLRESYLEIGSVGGVYVPIDSIRSEIETVLTAMVQGKRMSDIKFITNKNNYFPVISYPNLMSYDLNPKNCPENTIFLNRPLTYWQKYGWTVVVTVLVLSLIMFLMVKYAMSQRRQINMLKRHRNFVELMPVPYAKADVVYDDLGNVINIRYNVYNEAFGQILKDNCDQTDSYLIFPNNFIAEKTAELLREKKPVIFKYHFDKTDTYYIFTLCFVGGFKAKKKEHIDFVDLFAVDVTARQKTELQLKETTQRLDLTLNAAKLIPWEWNALTDEVTIDAYSMFDRGVHSLTEGGTVVGQKSVMSAAAYIGKVHPDDRPMLREYLAKVVAQEIREFKNEYRITMARHGKDVIEWIEATGMVTKTDEDGRPLLVTGSMKVITPSKEQEQALIDAREKATESDRMKSAFLANMSHEIRTPLNAIVGFSSLICETEDPEKRKEFSAIINQNNDMLLSLVNDVLDLAKIESNSLEIIYSNINLNNLLATIGETVKMRVHQGVSLNLVEGSSSCIISTDGNRLSQVIINLLTNAAKFTTQGSITYGYDNLDNKELYFYVKDTGIGISAENQSRLFKRFDKINNFMQGNGLGLSICKSIVERLGGTIGMKSRGEGKGCTFWFTIPYIPVDEQKNRESENSETLIEGFNNDIKAPVDAKFNDVDTVEPADVHPSAPEHDLSETPAPQEPEAPVSETTKAETEHDAAPEPDSQAAEADIDEPADQDKDRGKVILVAEDIEGNFLLLQHLIPKEYKVIHAWDGREAIDMFLNTHPDLVLMDISMPNVDGYAATESIRNISSKVPIVAVTAFAYASDRKRILRSGFNDYISKPVIREDLLEILKRYL